VRLVAGLELPTFHPYMTMVYERSATLDEVLSSLEGFQWDAGNSDKNWRRHAVRQIEAEQLFFNRPLVAAASEYPGTEQRFFALGRTDSGRELAVVFTIRGKLLRVISAWPMSRRERRTHAQAKSQDE
jgi:uncharacterized protein